MDAYLPSSMGWDRGILAISHGWISDQITSSAPVDVITMPGGPGLTARDHILWTQRSQWGFHTATPSMAVMGWSKKVKDVLKYVLNSNPITIFANPMRF